MRGRKLEADNMDVIKIVNFCPLKRHHKKPQKARHRLGEGVTTHVTGVDLYPKYYTHQCMKYIPIVNKTCQSKNEQYI